MKQTVLGLCLAALLTAPGLAQQPPPADGPQPEVRQQMEQDRSTARGQALAALSKDHADKVNAIISGLKPDGNSDMRAAAQHIDALLTPAESQAVLAARNTMMSDMRADRPAPDGAAAPPQNGDRPHRGMSAMRDDAGFALLMLSLDRDQMHQLFMRSRPPQ